MISKIEVKKTDTADLYMVSLASDRRERAERDLEMDEIVENILEYMELYNADYYGISTDFSFSFPFRAKKYNYPDTLYIRIEKNHLSEFYGLLAGIAAVNNLEYQYDMYYPTWTKK